MVAGIVICKLLHRLIFKTVIDILWLQLHVWCMALVATPASLIRSNQGMIPGKKSNFKRVRFLYILGLF